MSSVHPSVEGFDGVAASYHRGRPDYPASAVAHVASDLGLGPGRRVLDLAAGTGRFTQALVEVGAHVVAVEPLAGMRAVLQDLLPSVEVLDGTAEDIPLPDRSVDGVTVAQAFHWFDGAAAMDEIARVLRPGGGVALIWNRRDSDDPLQAGLTRLLEPYRGDTPAHRDEDWRGAFDGHSGFGPAQLRHFPHEQVADRSVVADRVASISFVALLPDDVRAELLAAVDQLTDELGLPERFALPYITEVHIRHRR